MFLSCLDLAICCVCTFLTDVGFPFSSLLRLERWPSGRLSLQCLDTLSMQETFGQDLPIGKRLQFSIEYGPVEILDFP